MTNLINALLAKAISSFQKIETAKPKDSLAVTLDKELISEAAKSRDEKSINLSVASATAFQAKIIAATPAFFNKIIATQPFDVIREEFLLDDGSLDDEKLLRVSKGLPSKEAGELLRLGVENSHLEVKLLECDSWGGVDTPAYNKIVRRLEQIERKLGQIIGKLDPVTLLPKRY